jgi:hypothetical protein
MKSIANRLIDEEGNIRFKDDFQCHKEGFLTAIDDCILVALPKK